MVTEHYGYMIVDSEEMFFFNKMEDALAVANLPRGSILDIEGLGRLKLVNVVPTQSKGENLDFLELCIYCNSEGGLYGL